MNTPSLGLCLLLFFFLKKKNCFPAVFCCFCFFVAAFVSFNTLLLLLLRCKCFHCFRCCLVALLLLLLLCLCFSCFPAVSCASGPPSAGPPLRPPPGFNTTAREFQRVPETLRAKMVAGDEKKALNVGPTVWALHFLWVGPLPTSFWLADAAAFPVAFASLFLFLCHFAAVFEVCAAVF